MGLLRDPVATRSHNSWKNLATRFGRFCVQKRTEEGLSKNTKLRHRWFYVAEDLFPFRIIYSTHPSDFNDALPLSSTAGAATLYPRSTTEGSVNGSPNRASSPSASRAASTFPGQAPPENKEGIVDSLLHWWSGDNSNNNGGSGSSNGARRDSADSLTRAPATATSASTNFFSFSPFSSAAGPMERYTVATSTQLSGILEAWGLLLEAWEPEEAEMNVLSFASPAMASPTSARSAGVGPNSQVDGTSSPTRQVGSAAAAATTAGVPFFERWRRTYGRIGVLCAESGMERSTATSYAAADTTPPSPSLNDSVGGGGTSPSQPSPLHSSVPASRLRKNDGRSGSVGGTGNSTFHTSANPLNVSSSFASRRHVHINDDSHYSPDSPAPIAIAHFFDVLLVRVVDLLLWRDPQLTACCLGILVSIYGHTAWASALCYLAGETLSASSEYCTALYSTQNGNIPATYVTAVLSKWFAAERLWWGAPLFMISVLAYPWTGEQQRRTVTLTDRERLRSVDHALRWLSATYEEETSIETASEKENEAAASCGSGVTVIVDVAKRVCEVLRANRLPISFLFLFNIIGAFTSWEAILVLFLWPMLIVSVSLAGIVVVVDWLRNQ